MLTAIHWGSCCTAMVESVLALEGNCSSTNTSYNLVLIPDQSNQRDLVEIAVPCLGSAVSKDLTCDTAKHGLAQPR